MILKFNFKNINISFKKFNFFINNILNVSQYVFEILIYLNFIMNKSAFILKKIFIYIINDIKFNSFNFYTIKLNSISLSKGKSYKRLNYRSKGRTDIILKNFCNIFLILHGEKN